MLVVARNTPATVALSSISTATALGSLPRIDHWREGGREVRGGRGGGSEGGGGEKEEDEVG